MCPVFGQGGGGASDSSPSFLEISDFDKNKEKLHSNLKYFELVVIYDLRHLKHL